MELTWERFLTDALPTSLRDAGLSAADATDISAEVEQRADDYARGGAASRRALRTPFLEDVADFDPVEAPVGCRADVAVVVRNSRLEDAHASRLVSDLQLRQITFLATGALNRWLTEHRNGEEDDPPVAVFAGVATHPRAYAGLQALALAAEGGGRRGFRMPDGPVPELPRADGPDASGGSVRRSGLAPPDGALLSHLQAVAAGEREVLFASSFSRLSRDSVALAGLVEFVLGHGGAMLTTNVLLRPGEAFCRRPPLIRPRSRDPLAVLTDARLAGLHAKHVRSVLADSQD